MRINKWEDTYTVGDTDVPTTQSQKVTMQPTLPEKVTRVRGTTMSPNHGIQEICSYTLLSSVDH